MSLTPKPSALNRIGYHNAVITGASSGIGLEIAKQLSDEGVHVLGISRTPPTSPPLNYTHIPTDLLNADEVANALAQIEETPPQLWINNAGCGLLGGAWSPTQEELDSTLELMLQVPIQLSRFFEKLCKQSPNKRNCLVQVSSLAVELPIPDMPYYNAAKSGLSSFTQSLLLDDNSPFKVIDFRPGDFNTPFIETKTVRQSSTEPNYLKFLEQQHKRAPSPRKAATDLIKALKQEQSGILRSGNFFQTVIAPLGPRLLPSKWLLRLVREYYKR